MIYTSGYGYNGSAVTNFTNSGATWDRIRIRIQFTLTSNSTLYWSDVSFDKWSGATLADLQLPDHRNQLVLNRNITNLVVDSNYSAVKKGSYALGRIQFWPHNYSGAVSGLTPVGDNGSYDWDDTPSPTANGHGSYQLFNLVDTQTVFSWSMHRYAGPAEMGMGTNTTGSGAPDWTSNSSTWNNSNFMVQVYVGNSVTTGSISDPSFSGSLVKGVATTLTATANGPGKITFYFDGKRIPNCINRTLVNVSGTMTATCSYKPASTKIGNLSAKYTPLDSSFTTAESGRVRVVPVKRSTSR